MGHPDEEEWRQEAALEEWFNERLTSQAREPVFAYLARHGDAVQERVDLCLSEAQRLLSAGYAGAALVRSAAGIEIAVKFFISKPLVLGAFLSDDWAEALTDRLIGGRSVNTRELLPAILRNWSIDVTTLVLSNGSQLWETIVAAVWDNRNGYVHAGATISDRDAAISIECLEKLLSHVVAPVARNLGFTREDTGRWSVVLAQGDRSINPPRTYATDSPL